MRRASRPAPIRPDPNQPAALLDPRTTPIEFGQRLWAAGLGRHADELVGLAQQSIRVLTGPAARGTRGVTRLGGDPDLPDEVDWPVFRGRPQLFLAQIDLAEVHRQWRSAPLPDAGRLLFFRHGDPDWWSEHPVHAVDSAAILFIAADRAVRPRPSPAGTAFRAQRAAVALELTFPHDLAERVESLAADAGRYDVVDDGQLDELLELVDSFGTAANGGEAPHHRLLGHVAPLQLPAPVGPDSSLLMQLDSDISTGMSWGDAGRIYWWLRDADLAAGNWHRAIWEEQSC